MKNYTQLIIWAVVVGATFAFLWRKGYLLRVSGYISETREELKKCTWPSTGELKESTVVVIITIALLGLFTVAVDFLISRVLNLLV